MNPEVSAVLDEVTNTVRYIVVDPSTQSAAIVDLVHDFVPNSGRTSTASADRLIKIVGQRGLTAVRSGEHVGWTSPAAGE